MVIRFQQTFNPPKPKASAWQALARLTVANATEERPMSNSESGSEIGGMTSVSSQIFERRIMGRDGARPSILKSMSSALSAVFDGFHPTAAITLSSIAIGVGSAPTSIVVRVGFGLPGPAKYSA